MSSPLSNKSGTLPTPTTFGERFTALRSRRRFLSQSYVGVIYTRRSRPGEADRHTTGVDFALSTTHFRGSQVLEVSGFALTTSPSLDGGGGAAYGLRLNYPNDPWNLRLAVSEVQARYDPAVGFAERRAYRRVNPGARFIRHTISNRVIRRYSFEADVDLRFDPQGYLETRRPDLQLLRTDFHSGDQFEFHIFPMLERLPRDFPIVGGVTLPAGSQYRFFRRQYRYITASRRPLALNGQYEDGTFYSGRRRQLTATFNLRPRAGWLVGLTGDYNDVHLQEGRFKTTLWRADVNTQFNPWVSLVQTWQYDTVTRGLGWQVRFRWIQKPGDDWFVVYTHNWINGETLSTLDRRASAKVVRTFRF